ncbi:MAG: hypothetical protein KBF37_05730 [Saprospiraceae bacterium]|nr:hypothetical protein [Saprospiraceae bacterium]MBP9209811.1 hypothetical protein [Saprospiraceae bacterium]MBV6473368.1 hypothetical protein [Saprospiraceae bacterium]
MELWEFEFEWLRIRHFVKKRIGSQSLPELNAILLLIGVQELGRTRAERFSKEEKTDLMHVASCRLLSEDGYYSFKGLDQDGWPHYEMLKPFRLRGVEQQEQYLREKIIDYFKREYADELAALESHEGPC